jgi:hypothetical protein
VRWRPRISGFCVIAVLLVALAIPASASAKSSRLISGTLSKPGYTVLALAENGGATSAHTKHGRFKVRAPAELVTLQLRAPDGTYAGPVVFGVQKHGRRAILGVRAGARLGRIVVKPGKGYAKVKRRVRRKWGDTTRFARAKKGVPIGAGKLGQVRSRHTRNGVPGDSDLDGVPDRLDIDDDGDRILDGYDRSIRRRPSPAASQSAGSPGPLSLYFFDVQSSLSWAMPEETVNVNGGSTDQQIDLAEQKRGQLSLRGEGDFDKGTAELDCGGLIYCSKGGTGRWEPGLQRSDNGGGDPRATAPRYPECCDADGDGLGSFVSTSYHGPPGSEHHAGFELYPGATTDQIHAGDILIDQGTIDGTLVQIPASMGFVFSTFPALASYDDGQGDSATFSYPHPGQCGFMGPCTEAVRSSANGDVVLTLTFWRPQRRSIEGDSGEGKWIDIGNLAYAITAELQVERPMMGEAPPPGGFCKRDSYLAVDPSMTPLSVAPGGQTPFSSSEAVYGDLSGDQPSNPTNTFTDTLDITQCLAALGTSIQSAPKLELAVWAYAVNADDGPTPSAPYAYSRTTFRYQP